MKIRQPSTANGFRRTYHAVRRQILAMGQPHYEVGIHLPDQGMILRTWEPDRLQTCIPWLRHMNACGGHIYLRPKVSVGLVLLDDVSLAGINRLRHDGLPPCVIVETSPDNYQCWIRLIHNTKRQALPPDLIRRLLRCLAQRYSTDPCSTDWRHFGRLAGFTNQKPHHASASGQPFVKLRFASSIVAPEGRAHLLRARVERKADKRRVNTSLKQLEPGHYGVRLCRLLTRNKRRSWVHEPDYSRLDFMIAKEMLSEGWGREIAERVILEGSPDLSIRKRGHIEDYVRRTVRAAGFEVFPFSPPP